MYIYLQCTISEETNNRKKKKRKKIERSREFERETTKQKVNLCKRVPSSHGSPPGGKLFDPSGTSTQGHYALSISQ